MFKLTKIYIAMFFLGIGLLFLWPNISLAEEMVNLYLYFDLGKNEVTKDREAVKNIELKDEISPYTLDTLETPQKTDYYFTITNFLGGQSDPIYFEPTDGKYTLKVPSVEGGSKVDVYYLDTLKLSMDISSLAICNINSKCEPENGENSQNCIVDCFASEVEKIRNSRTDLEPGTPLTGGNSNTDTPTSTTPTKTPILGLIVGLIMITGGIGYGVYRFIQRYRGDE